MTRKSRAVVCRTLHEPVSVETVEVAAPRCDEVTIRVRACGVCHTDLSVTNGTLPMPLPIVLGHEACGIVEEIGQGVDDVTVGETVIVSWIPMCGTCRYCRMDRPALCEAGERAVHTLPDGSCGLRDAAGSSLHHLAGVSVMAEYATLHRDSVIAIDQEVPPAAAALVSCAVMTGVGAVLNTARVTPGSSVAVFGVGGVGLNAVQGSVLAGAGPIIAIDRDGRKLARALELGATHAIDATSGDALRKIRSITPGGVDYAFECIGQGSTIAQAYKSVRKGGMAVVVGISGPKDSVRLNAFSIPFQEKILAGSMYGSAQPRRDFPVLLDHYRNGRLRLDELVTETYGIEDAPRAFRDLEQGSNARGVIVFE